MKNFETQAPQGETMFTAIDALPSNVDFIEHKATTEGLIVAHSETGHHHVMESQKAVMFTIDGNPFIAYVKLDEPTELVHKRADKPHETVLFQPGIYQLNRQRQQIQNNIYRVVD